MKGLILAGGTGSRLQPTTRVVSKQLLQVYDKPMIYYPLSVLMLAGIREVLVISTPDDRPFFERLLGDGSPLGLRVSHAVQDEPAGLAHAFVVGAEHVAEDCAALVLGDNIFHGQGLFTLLQRSVDTITRGSAGCCLYGYHVNDPERYAVAETDRRGRILSIDEKPSVARTDRAVTGLYFYDNDVLDIAARLTPSDRGELEITDVNRVYAARRRAELTDLGRGFAWFDTGTHDSMLDAAEYVRAIQTRQGVRIACLEEIALRMGFIDAIECYELGEQQGTSSYGRYVMEIAKSWTSPDRDHVG